MRTNIKKESGVTLIILVTTIIVIMILGTVTINMALGENGYFSKTREQEERMEELITREEEELDATFQEFESTLVEDEQPEEITLTLDITTIEKEIESGSTETQILTATLVNATGDLEWISSNEEIAEVEGNRILWNSNAKIRRYCNNNSKVWRKKCNLYCNNHRKSSNWDY